MVTKPTTKTATPTTTTVVPYRGDTYSVMTSANYLMNPLTAWQISYSFSQANYGQNNIADGLPLGLDYTRHSATIGVTRKLTRNV